MLVQNVLILGLHEFFKKNRLETRLIVKYNVTDASVPTLLYTYMSKGGTTIDGATMFDKAMIDGTEVSITDLDFASGQIQFSEGKHTVKYTLKDPTFIGAEMNMETLTKLGAMFAQCSSIVSVEIPNSVTSIGVNAFDHCTSLSSITIPNNVTSIGDEAFTNCIGLTSITIADSVIRIGERTFYDCESLSSITIPDSVTSIRGWAFSSCVGLSSVTIGSGIRTISEGAFNGCESLTSVTVEAATPPILNDFVFDGVSGNMRIYVPVDSVDAYKSAWLEYSSMILAIEA